jgi:hypothetical protein
MFSMQTLLLGIAIPIVQMASATPTPQDADVPAGLKIVDQLFIF